MLKVTAHAGPIATAKQFNQLGTLDIGYERLEPLADYKFVLVVRDLGALPMARMDNYPRWSASLFDLVARAAMISLTGKEELPPPSNETAPFAFATAMCVFIEHLPGGRDQNKERLGSIEITQVGKQRGLYEARFTEDLFPKRVVQFVHRPKRLVHWDLISRAIAWALAGQEQLPPRPALALPQDYMVDGKPMIAVDSLVQPARGGFERWMAWSGKKMIERDEQPQRLAPEAYFTRFIGTTV